MGLILKLLISRGNHYRFIIDDRLTDDEKWRKYEKNIAVLLSTFLVAGLAACGDASATTTETETKSEIGSNSTAKSDSEKKTEEDTPETVTITSLNANKEEIELEVPYNPERIAILDLAALDIIDNLGEGDRVVGMANTSIDYLSSYSDNNDIEKLGTIKEADFEAVMACEPDVIFIGGRLSSSYDALSEIAPVVFLATDSEIGLVKSVDKNATTVASMFGKEEEVAAKTGDFQKRIAALSETAEGKTALVGMTTSGSFNLLGNNGRCSIIGTEIGFDNLTADSEAGGAQENRGKDGNSNAGAAHGNEASFELVSEQNPDYIFILDRDSAIGTEGAQLAKDIMENELVMGTEAYKNGHLIYLEHPAVWYTAEGGITALDTMLSDLESDI